MGGAIVPAAGQGKNQLKEKRRTRHNPQRVRCGACRRSPRGYPNALWMVYTTAGQLQVCSECFDFAIELVRQMSQRQSCLKRPRSLARKNPPDVFAGVTMTQPAEMAEDLQGGGNVA